jgi:hypothetical protein
VVGDQRNREGEDPTHQRDDPELVCRNFLHVSAVYGIQPRTSLRTQPALRRTYHYMFLSSTTLRRIRRAPIEPRPRPPEGDPDSSNRAIVLIVLLGDDTPDRRFRVAHQPRQQPGLRIEIHRHQGPAGRRPLDDLGEVLRS